MKEALMGISDRILLIKRAIIKTINNELMNIAQIESSRHRASYNFVVNLLSGIADIPLLPQKTTINLEKAVDRQLTFLYIESINSTRTKLSIRRNLSGYALSDLYVSSIPIWSHFTRLFYRLEWEYILRNLILFLHMQRSCYEAYANEGSQRILYP